MTSSVTTAEDWVSRCMLCAMEAAMAGSPVYPRWTPFLSCHGAVARWMASIQATV